MMKSAEDAVYDAVIDILREMDREEAKRIFGLLVGKLITDIESGVGTVLQQRIRELRTPLRETPRAE